MLLYCVFLSQAIVVLCSSGSSIIDPWKQQCTKKSIGKKDCRVYTFAFTLIEPRSFIVGSKVEGPRVELIKRICKLAKKRCVTAAVSSKYCWNKETKLSEVLNGRWYDACVGVNLLPRLLASYASAAVPFFKIPYLIGIVKKGSLRTVKDFKTAENNLKVAIVNRQDNPQGALIQAIKDAGFLIEESNLIRVQRPEGINVESANIVDMVNTGQVDLGLVTAALVSLDSVKELFVLDNFERGNLGMMARKDDLQFLHWWDKTMEQFICSKEYLPFCEKMKTDFGDFGVHCVSTETRKSVCNY